MQTRKYKDSKKTSGLFSLLNYITPFWENNKDTIKPKTEEKGSSLLSQG